MRFLQPRLSAAMRKGFSSEKIEVDVDVRKKAETGEEIDSPWHLILYNDEEHTFDEVTRQLIKALGCSHSHAESLTWKVHSEGKATVFEGTFEECLRVNGVLQEIELITEIKG